MINTTITPITYEDTAKLLQISYTGIWKAAKRGVFTRLPTIGNEQKLVKEQVELFIGKRQLRIDRLSSTELAKWMEINNAVTNPTVVTPAANMQQETSYKNLATSFNDFLLQCPPDVKKALYLLKHLSTQLIPTIDDTGEINSEEKKTIIQLLSEASELIAMSLENNTLDEEILNEYIKDKDIQLMYWLAIITPLASVLINWLQKQPNPPIEQLTQLIQSTLVPA